MFCEQLKFFRKAIGYSQDKISVLLGITQQAYAHYENGTREPNLDTIKKLCIIFDCTADELLELETPTQRKKVQINNSFNNSRNINVKL